jgi:hypothetical protein
MLSFGHCARRGSDTHTICISATSFLGAAFYCQLTCAFCRDKTAPSVLPWRRRLLLLRRRSAPSKSLLATRLNFLAHRYGLFSQRRVVGIRLDDAVIVGARCRADAFGLAKEASNSHTVVLRCTAA